LHGFTKGVFGVAAFFWVGIGQSGRTGSRAWLPSEKLTVFQR
jgi:hypothetical protein